ncbi:predicted protein [Postia placenta Mad-698-R]|nr:predicted protein [Postia placenta Mad-698-R]
MNSKNFFVALLMYALSPWAHLLGGSVEKWFTRGMIQLDKYLTRRKDGPENKLKASFMRWWHDRFDVFYWTPQELALDAFHAATGYTSWKRPEHEEICARSRVEPRVKREGKVRIEWYPSIFAWKRLVRECEGLPFIRKDEMYTYISREPNEDLNLAEIRRKLNLENIHIIDWRRGTLFTPGNQDRLSLVAFNNLVHVEKKVPTRYFGRPERQPMDTLYVIEIPSEQTLALRHRRAQMLRRWYAKLLGPNDTRAGILWFAMISWAALTSKERIPLPGYYRAFRKVSYFRDVCMILSLLVSAAISLLAAALQEVDLLRYSAVTLAATVFFWNTNPRAVDCLDRAVMDVFYVLSRPVLCCYRILWDVVARSMRRVGRVLVDSWGVVAWGMCEAGWLLVEWLVHTLGYDGEVEVGEEEEGEEDL